MGGWGGHAGYYGSVLPSWRYRARLLQEMSTWDAHSLAHLDTRMQPCIFRMQGYLPRDLYQLDCAYGTEQDLRELIKVFHEHKIKVCADVVVNHRCASYQGSDGKWNKFGGRLAWDSTAICSNNPAFGGRGNPKQGDDYAAAPNVDHSQERIRNVSPACCSEERFFVLMH